ncbi:TRAP transporter substrate-binding protein [Roseomonas sp. OT10]|uniref:TRAP transporter substrate-binding protein n=1 Tax=Roseomonas cutis TaxID=2897332 RepID=UPI001E54381A|nr:TRAP transporter substrate-binding protein [Roseomonas sp. OT10]UFN51196.1 TRAP transporter substrate-binding protein [Roseomonas sp. OT10]
MPWLRGLAAALGALATAGAAAPAAAQQAEAAPIQLKIVGGLAGVSQFVRYEEPFWRQKVKELTQGRVRAEIAPSDGSGIRNQEMLQLMRLGVVPFGTALLAVVAGEEPELNAVDLPALNPDMATLRQSVRLYRNRLERILKERYGIELLAIYAYPAQVIYCTRPFTGLSDLQGRRIRTSSVGQSELVTAVGATPVLTPFAELVEAVRNGVVDCAITGTLSGIEIGLYEVTSYIHAMSISWGLSFFGANTAAWEALPPDIRQTLRDGLAKLESDIWDASERETTEGLACNTGQASCAMRRHGRMTLVPVTPVDDAYRRRLLISTVLPSWVQRCGPECADSWNETFGPVLGIRVSAD